MDKNKNLQKYAETNGCTACIHYKTTNQYWCYMFKHQRPMGGCGQFKTSHFKKRSNKNE